MSEVRGKIVSIGKVVTNEKNTWKKLSFAIEIPNEFKPDWPKFAKFEVGCGVEAEKDKVAEFIKFRKLDELVDVSYNHGGFKFADKETGEDIYCTKLEAWKVFSVKEDEVQNDEPRGFDGDEDDAPF